MFVLHVLPVDLARGAQVFARLAVDALNERDGDRHEIAVIFEGGTSAVHAVHQLRVPQGRWRSAGLDLRAALRLRRLVRRLDPDVVVAHGGEVVKYATIVSRHAPVVGHAIGVMPAKALSGVRGAAWRGWWNGCRAVVAVSNDVARQLEELGVRRDRVRVVANGRPVPPPPTRAMTKSDPRVLFVGHVARSKRPELFVEVVRRVRERGVRCDAVVAGDGPLLDRVVALGRRHDVQVLGRRDDVQELMRSSAVFVFPSIPVGEGMPGVLIEAGLAGLPVVCTDVPGARDVVVDQVTGLIVDAVDEEGLVCALERLVRDGPLRARMGHAAYHRCAELFSMDRSVDQWAEVLRAVVGTHQSTPDDDG